MEASEIAPCSLYIYINKPQWRTKYNFAGMFWVDKSALSKSSLLKDELSTGSSVDFSMIPISRYVLKALLYLVVTAGLIDELSYKLIIEIAKWIYKTPV